MLELGWLLGSAEFDLSEVLVVRHAPIEKSLKRVLPWLVAERPDLFLAYQQIQWRTLEKAMTSGRYIASFVGQEPASATFAGMYRIGDWRTLDYDGYQSFPGNSELELLGMTGRAPEMPDCLAFDLEALSHFSEWTGRLVIAWPKPHQQWWRWAAGGRFGVQAIMPESRFVRDVPDWRELVLSWAELQSLPSTWAAALSQWRGIYFIYDTHRASGNVGSAYGEDNILADGGTMRGQGMAETKHCAHPALPIFGSASCSAPHPISKLGRSSPSRRTGKSGFIQGSSG